MAGTIQKRDEFLSRIASKLGREQNLKGVELPEWKHNVHWEVLKDASQDELIEVLKKRCSKIHTEVIETTKEELHNVLKNNISKHGGGPVITSQDERFEQYGVVTLFDELKAEGTKVHTWDKNMLREENISIAEQSNIGLTFCEYALAESGTVVLAASDANGRSVSLLPTVHITIIERNQIVPRSTQAMHDLNLKVLQGETIPSSINLISGPSNSADIEMNLVVGVHGPVRATYIII